ncbi:DinB family protein [Aeromicrobium sp. NPDC092404]|uniref:DinB family protein n=1 Tax=Aeromicrobium sp. NPDC092404 TaxID=3154976 RepID=UPI00342D734A
MTWTVPTPTPAPEGPMTGPDRPLLEEMLAHHRATLLSICAGLTAEQLAERPIPSTSLTLLGLVRHMAKVERVWFRKRLAQQDIEHLHNFEARDDTDFNVIDPADAERAVAELIREQQEADKVAKALDLDVTFESHGEDMSLRTLYLHMIQEYARHNGHADLIREAIDGVTSR